MIQRCLVVASQISMADLPCPDPEAEAAPEGSPDLNGLAKVWNDDDTIRTMVLHTKSLLAWPSPKMTGVINFNTMRQNSAVIQTVLGVWCTRVATPQTVYIDHMRDEVAKFRTKLAMPDDPMQVNCDAGSLRCFVTYIVKRHDGARRRDPVVASLFEFVSGYWPVMVRKNSNPACLEDQAHEDETGENGENGEDVNSGVDLEKDAHLNDEEIARMLGVVEHECEETALDSLESDVYFAMAEPVEPLRDSQVPNDSLCDDGYFGHPPEKTAPVPESLVPEPSQPELMGPTVDLAEVSPPITPTELEMTPPPAPKTTPASSEPEVVEVLESPPKKKSSLFGDVLTLENIQKKIDSLKAVQQRLQVQQCARPTLGVNVPACFDGGAETLPFDPEPIAEELKRLPSPPKPDLTGVPKKFRKFVVNSEEPFWNHCGEHEANTEIEEIADYNIFFEGCIDGFMQLDCVKSDMIPAN